MKKARWKKTIAAGAVLMSLGMVCPVASLQAEEVTDASDSEVNPCADQIGYIYRKHNGRIQKRRWNYTEGKWVDKKWIDVGPAA